MLDDPRPVLPAPGWYADPEDGSRRWWNGIAWAERGKGPSGLLGSTGVPLGVSVNPWPVWLLVLLPLVSLVPLLTVDLGAWFRAALVAAEAGRASVLPPGFLLSQVLGLVVVVLNLVLAAADRSALRSRGVAAPFHWAWTLLSPLVYLIGRTVVLHRRVGRGSAPLWVYLLVSLVAGIAVGLLLVNALLPALLQLAPPS